MSRVSDLMRRRRLDSGVPAGPVDRHSLAQLVIGQRAVVVGYDESMESCTARRLFDLGLTPGIEVESVRRAPLRDPVIYRVGDYEIALRAEQARGILVEAVR